MLCNLSIKCFVVCNIERNGVGILDATGELLSTFEGSACYNVVSIKAADEWITLRTNRDLNTSITDLAISRAS
jgi:hypothetical protein